LHFNNKKISKKPSVSSGKKIQKFRKKQVPRNYMNSRERVKERKESSGSKGSSRSKCPEK